MQILSNANICSVKHLQNFCQSGSQNMIEYLLYNGIECSLSDATNSH